MSSYTNSPKHFNSIEQNLRDLILFKDRFSVPYTLKDKYPAIYGGKFKTTVRGVETCIKEVVDVLRRLQPLCVSLQYAHNHEGTLDREIQVQTEILMSDKRTAQDLTPLGLYNALRCTRYQIETDRLKELRELTTAEENALFFLDEMIITLAHYIVSEMPEDKTNRWSIE